MTTNFTLEPSDLADFADDMARTFGASYVDKKNSLTMKYVGKFLGLLGIVDEEQFLKRFATTVGTTIYLPFEPGVITPDWPLYAQFVVITHELEHVSQFHEEGAYRFCARYLFLKADRAHYEMDAYGCHVELARYFGRKVDFDDLAANMKSYALDDLDIDVCRVFWTSVDAQAQNGIYTRPSTREAIAWFEKHATKELLS